MKTSFAAFLLLLALPSAAATISGTVTPGGMTVAAYDASGLLAATTTAAADGRYTLTVNPGFYRVLAYDPAGVYATSFYANAESFDTSAVLDLRNASATSINMTLVRAGFIAGAIASPAGARENITVAAYNLSGTLRGFTRTDAAGQYTLVLPPGTYKLVAFDETGFYATSFHAGQATFGTSTPISVTTAATSAANFSLVESGLVLGIVRSAVTQESLPNIRITAYAASGEAVARAISDGMGRYAMTLAPGAYRLVFDDAAAGLYASVYWPDAESFDTSPFLHVTSAQTSTADAALTRGARLTGVVRDATGAALPNMIVAAYNSSGTTRTETVSDANGRYSLLVPPGTYRIGAFDRTLAYAPLFYPQQPAFGAATAIAVVSAQIVNGLDVTLARAAHVSGTVRDATTSAPLAGMAVFAFDASGHEIASTSTDASGRFALAFSPGTYRFAAADPLGRYATAFFENARTFETARNVAIAAAQSLTLDFAVTQRGAATRRRSVRK